MRKPTGSSSRSNLPPLVKSTGFGLKGLPLPSGLTKEISRSAAEKVIPVIENSFCVTVEISEENVTLNEVRDAKISLKSSLETADDNFVLH